MANQLKGNELVQYLIEMSPEQLRDELENIHPADILDALDEYEGDAIALFSKLPTDKLAEIIEEAEEIDKSDLFYMVDDKRKREIISEMASDELVDLLEKIDPAEAKSLLKGMDAEEAKELAELMSYHPDSAGGIMATEFVAVKEDMTVLDTLKYLQKAGEEAESLSYLYVLDQKQILKGVVSLRDIVIGSFEDPIRELINPKVISVKPDVDQEEVAWIFNKYGFSSLPVVDEDGSMLGIITADDVLDIVVEESTEDFEKMAALAHNEGEYLETGVFGLARRRIYWLLFLMVSATFTGFIIQGYEEALAQVVILAAFIPMLMDTGGNAGAQSATLIIRGMALGEIATQDYMRVIFKEVRVSMVVGLALAVVNALRIWWMNQDLLLGITVSIALFFTIVIAKTVGCSLPIVARKLKVDPAIMAAPIITTIVDALSLLIYFRMAGLFYLS